MALTNVLLRIISQEARYDHIFEAPLCTRSTSTTKQSCPYPNYALTNTPRLNSTTTGIIYYTKSDIVRCAQHRGIAYAQCYWFGYSSKNASPCVATSNRFHLGRLIDKSTRSEINNNSQWKPMNYSFVRVSNRKVVISLSEPIMTIRACIVIALF
jgi:hypothetical protein